MDPVVIAFTLGIVMVGELACAVKGMAAPDRIRLGDGSGLGKLNDRSQRSPLSEFETRFMREDEVTVYLSMLGQEGRKSRDGTFSGHRPA